MAGKRKLYSWRNLVIALIMIASLTLMTLSVEHILPEWIFYAFCIALLYGFIYILARQLHPRIKSAQWGWVMVTSNLVPILVVHPLVQALVTDEGYTKVQRMGISFIACCVTVLLILIILSLIFRNKKREQK